MPRELHPPQPLVLVLGLPKCGTTSLHHAFQSAGFTSIHWAVGQKANLTKDKELRLLGTDGQERLVCRLINEAVQMGEMPLARLPPGTNAVAEMNGVWWTKLNKEAAGIFPQMSMLDLLMDSYPDAYYILNVRKEEDWLRSVDNHNDLRRRLVAADLPNLPRGVGAADEELISWAKDHHRRVRVKVQARGLRFLHFHLDHQGGQDLSRFLGRRVSWGHYNATDR